MIYRPKHMSVQYSPSMQVHTLHFDFGFGEKRLRKFFEKLKVMQARLIERYDAIDEEVPDICEIQLRDHGINFKDFFDMESE